MDIPRQVKALVKKYNSRNPYLLAKLLKIEIIYTPMTYMPGFCDKLFNIKFIVINSNLEEYLQRQVCAHELGHALLHKGMGYFFITQNTLQCPGKFEREANEFAWELLYDEEYCQYAYDGDIDWYIKEEGIAELAKYAKK
jgi:Zn-dependent peptidase ImmA (M78 family)